MSVDDQDSLEPLVCQSVENFPNYSQVSVDAQCNRAGKRTKVRRNPINYHWKDRYTQRVSRFHRNPLSKNAIDAQTQVSMLLGTPERKHTAIISLEIFLHHHPIHVANAHWCSPSMDSPSRRSLILGKGGIGIAIKPALTRLCGRDDWMPARPRVFAGVLIW